MIILIHKLINSCETGESIEKSISFNWKTSAVPQFMNQHPSTHTKKLKTLTYKNHKLTQKHNSVQFFFIFISYLKKQILSALSSLDLLPVLLCPVLHVMCRVRDLIPRPVQLIRPDRVLTRRVSVHPIEHEAGGGAEPAGGDESGEDEEQRYGGGDEDGAEYDEEWGGEDEADDGGGEGEAGEDHERSAEGDGGGGLGHLVGELLLVGVVAGLHLSH